MAPREKDFEVDFENVYILIFFVLIVYILVVYINSCILRDWREKKLGNELKLSDFF